MAGGLVNTAVAVAVHPLASEAVTVYEPAVSPLSVAADPPEDQL